MRPETLSIEIDSAKLAAHNRSQMVRCHAVAQTQARADRSDPHVYNRTMCHLLAGLAAIDDYNVDWVKQARETVTEEKFMVLVPTNMRRP